MPTDSSSCSSSSSASPSMSPSPSSALGPQLYKDKAPSKSDDRFDLVVGELEDMLVDPYFLQLQHDFLSTHSPSFDLSTTENKLIYTDIFQLYTSTMEAYIDQRLKNRFSWFTMTELMEGLVKRRKSGKEGLDGEVFEVLASMGEFEVFKEVMEAFKREQTGTGFDFSGLLSVQSASSRIPPASSSSSTSTKLFLGNTVGSTSSNVGGPVLGVGTGVTGVMAQAAEADCRAK
ncbi:the ARF-like 2 binding protein BART-domain-containing protein [Phlyctochytrium arcticum]|nr:the ARF-like 2 binding protein BART-domain-containing protein [Phlyctochytrium arcticum]KAI9095245.1 the ARF-like 2 binding protein BART-domain-containing protein [Phlyctochytrium arcticum]